jgi:Tfp pilus assembly protein PilX
MNKKEYKSNKKVSKTDKNQAGTATVIAAMIMSLLVGFVTLAISRTTNETMAVSNDIAEAKAFAAAQASLENMTMQADDKFEARLDLTSADKINIQNNYPSGIGNYEFTQNVEKVGSNEVLDATGQNFQGLKQIRDTWQFTATAADTVSGVQSILRRRFYNNRIPLFQFGIFYDDDLEFHPGPRFDFGGRVHSNGNLFLKGGDLHFNSRVTATREIITDVMRNGEAASNGSGIKIKNASNVEVALYDSATGTSIGSAKTTAVGGATNIYASNTDMPPLYANPAWDTMKTRFDGNLAARLPALKLPIKLGLATVNPDYIEIVKRGKVVGDKWNNGTGTVASPNIVDVTAATADPLLVSKQRYVNGNGIRVSLSDKQNLLPGCAAAPSGCGIRLDGNQTGTGDIANTTDPRGYQPKPYKLNGVEVQATRVNGNRMYNAGKENWIKIESVTSDATSGVVTTTDITEDILSLGVTEEAKPIIGINGANTNFNFFNIPGSSRDARSIIKLQRFVMPGSNIKTGGNLYSTNYVWSGNNYNLVVSNDSDAVTGDDVNPRTALADLTAHQVSGTAYIGAATKNIQIVPFPIMMFDSREGVYSEGATLPAGTVTANGVMSMVDIDVANLRKFLMGEAGTTVTFPSKIAGGPDFSGSNISQDRGWVFSVSDRRGDFDFDGEYDMEDVYGNNDGNLQKGEDVNGNGTLQCDCGTAITGFGKEAPRYSYTYAPEAASVVNTPFYRRGVRLINGETVPGKYDTSVPTDTKGFAFSSENGVYVKGNYNATGVNVYGAPTPAANFIPQNDVNHIPASIAADAITILSKSWEDSKSFASPYSTSGRVASETTVRFGIISGDAISSLSGSPNQGISGEYKLGGGVHNFKRFLEDWGGKYLNYSGSLINMFYAHNNTGTYKASVKIYNAPNRNWTFDTSFLDMNRLPPATPFFQTLKLTGFERVNQ